MDGSRFDALARSLAGRASRRRALGLAVAGAFAPLAAAARPEPASCMTIGKRCVDRGAVPATDAIGPARGSRGRRKPCAKCCSGFAAQDADGKFRCACKTDGLDCDHPSQCCAGRCTNGRCSVSPAGVACGGRCVDLETDPLNCGGCGNRCPVNETCASGQCHCGEGGSTAPFTCCPDRGGVAACSAVGGPSFIVADSCAVVGACPDGYAVCIGPLGKCQACCPPGTTCDASGGFCRQGGAGADRRRARFGGMRSRQGRTDRHR